MERRCWVTYTASYLPLWGVEDEPASELGTSAQHSCSTPWPAAGPGIVTATDPHGGKVLGGVHAGDGVRPTYDSTYVGPAGRERPSNSLVRVDRVRSEQALDHCLICASPLPLGGSFTRLWRHVLPHGSGPPFSLGVTTGTHSSLNRGSVRHRRPAANWWRMPLLTSLLTVRTNLHQS